MKKYKDFINESINIDTIKIYHSTESEKDAFSILENGFDINISRRYRMEGPGMGAFFSLKDVKCLNYGRYIIEFEISKDNFSRYIILNTFSKCTENLSKEIFGYVKSVSDQIKDVDLELYKDENIQKDLSNGYFPDFKSNGNIKGVVGCERFPGLINIHLYDPSIAKPLRIV